MQLQGLTDWKGGHQSYKPMSFKLLIIQAPVMYMLIHSRSPVFLVTVEAPLSTPQISQAQYPVISTVIWRLQIVSYIYSNMEATNSQLYLQ